MKKKKLKRKVSHKAAVKLAAKKVAKKNSPSKKKAPKTKKTMFGDLVKGVWVVEKGGRFYTEDELGTVEFVGSGFEEFLAKDLAEGVANKVGDGAQAVPLKDFFANHYTIDEATGNIVVGTAPIGEAMPLKVLLKGKREYWLNCIKGAHQSVKDVRNTYRDDMGSAMKYLKNAQLGLVGFDKWAKQYG